MKPQIKHSFFVFILLLSLYPANLKSGLKSMIASKAQYCDANCATGNKSMQRLAYCAFNSNNIPECSKSIVKVITQYKTNFSEHAPLLQTDEDADIKNLDKTYFALPRISGEILLQMAQTRVEDYSLKKNTRKFTNPKSGNLFVLRKFFKGYIKSTFFDPESQEHKDFMERLKKNFEAKTSRDSRIFSSRNDLDMANRLGYIGVIFQIDPLKVQRETGKRNAHGVILYSPTGQRNLTGFFFETPFKGGEISKGDFVYFSRIDSDKKNFVLPVRRRKPLTGFANYKLSSVGTVAETSLHVLEKDPKPALPKRIARS